MKTRIQFLATLRLLWEEFVELRPSVVALGLVATGNIIMGVSLFFGAILKLLGAA